MDKYIRKEHIRNAVQKRRNDSCGAECYAYSRVLDDIEATPVETILHGNWIWSQKDFEYRCSCCSCTFDYNSTYGIFDHNFEYANYCPHCGAIMK